MPSAVATPPLSTSMRATTPFASIASTPGGADAGCTYAHSAVALGGGVRSPTAVFRSAMDMPMRIGPAASAETENAPGVGAGVGAGAVESAAGGTLSVFGAAESPDPGDFSTVQAAAASST